MFGQQPVNININVNINPQNVYLQSTNHMPDVVTTRVMRVMYIIIIQTYKSLTMYKTGDAFKR